MFGERNGGNPHRLEPDDVLGENLFEAIRSNLRLCHVHVSGLHPAKRHPVSWAVQRSRVQSLFASQGWDYGRYSWEAYPRQTPVC